MRKYKLSIDVTTHWTIDIDAESEDEASEIARGMDFDQIEGSGELDSMWADVTVYDVVEVGPEEEDE